MSGANYAKIRKAIPEIANTEEAADLERLAERLDGAEELEKLVKSEAGSKLRGHFSEEMARTISELLTLKDEFDYTPIVERLRVQIRFYKMFGQAESEAETLRTIIDEAIDSIVA